jgi:dienelactone hydrolase
LRVLALLWLAPLAWLVAPRPALAQLCSPLPAPTADYRGFQGRIFEDPKTGAKMPYRLFKPAGYDPAKAYPLVLYLHHAGLVGTDNCRQLTGEAGSGGYGGVFANSAQRKYPHIIVAPHATNNTFGWGGGMGGSFAKPAHATHALIHQILTAIRAELNVDPRRIYVTGISMGCFGTWDLIMRNPTYFAAASAQSCGGDPAGLPRIVNVPMWSFCGSEDQYFAKQSDLMAAEFKKLNPLDFTYTVMPGVGHSVINRGYDWVGPPSLVDWLFSKVNPVAAPLVVGDGGVPLASADAGASVDGRAPDARGTDGGDGGGAGGGSASGGAGGNAGAGDGGGPGRSGGSGSGSAGRGAGLSERDAGAAGAGAGGGSPRAVPGAGGEGAQDPAPMAADPGGCSCSVGARPAPAVGSVALGAPALAWLRRRRRG